MFGKWYRKHQKLLTIVLLFSLPIVPLVLSRYPFPRLHLLEKLSSLFVHPISSLINNSLSGMGVLRDRYVYLVGVADENQALREEVTLLHEIILGLQETTHENNRLRELWDIEAPELYERRVGQVIGQSASPEHFGYYINLGSRHGLRPRLPVVTAEGVVGMLLEVYSHSSLFVSVVDPSHSVDALVTRSRARSLVEGQGKQLLGRLKYLDRSEDLRVGDHMITSGLDGIFPKGLSVGYIVSVRRPQIGISQEAQLRPSVDLGKLEEVTVLFKEENNALALSSDALQEGT